MEGKMEGKIVYFLNPGHENTDEVLRIARLRAEELDIKKILVASNTGATAVKATEVFGGRQIVAVSLYAGYWEPNVQAFTEENKRKVESKGGVVFSGPLAFAGVDRAMRKKFNMYLTGSIVANTLYIFGQGLKVACELGCMAADAGLVRTDEDVISIAGASSGADTALVLRPVNTTDFFDLRVREILCKPHF